MSTPTTNSFWNQTTPAAPSGDQNAVIQTDGSTPQDSRTIYPKKATSSLRGTVKPDNLTITVASDGTLTAIASAGTVISTASALGCVLDCNLLTGAKIGGGTPTDNTAKINAFLATATATAPVKLIVDGGSACTGIKIPAGGHCTIEGIGLDSGFWVLTGANAHAIANEAGSGGSGYPLMDPATTPPAQGAHVTIRNLFINGNRGNGTTGNSTTGNPTGIVTGAQVWFFGIDLISLTDVLIENVTFYDIAAYSIRLGNVTRWAVKGCTLNAPSAALHTDGIHVDGPAQYGVVDGCTFLTLGDDVVALNAPEGYGGNISNTVISNCVAIGCLTFFRCYSKIATQYTVMDTSIVNCNGSLVHNGSVTSAAFFLGNGSGATDSISGFKASNCTFASDRYYLKIADPCGDVVLQNQTWDSPTNANPFIWFDSSATVSSLTLSKCKIYRTSSGSAAAYGLAASATSTIAKLTVDFAVENESGGGYAAIADFLSMTNLSIGLLYIESLDPTYITALTASFTGITAIAGEGVLGTGSQIADSLMSNNYPYISATGANAGLACVKVGGTVYLISNASGAGVSSLNSLTGALSLIGGTGVSLTPSGSSITINATGGGGTSAVCSHAVLGSPNRALSTVYQNTSSFPLIVIYTDSSG